MVLTASGRSSVVRSAPATTSLTTFRPAPEFSGETDSLAEEDGFELAVPPRRQRLWAATPGRPEPVSGSAFRAAVSDWQRPEEPFAGAGPMVRIRFPPAASQERTPPTGPAGWAWTSSKR